MRHRGPGEEGHAQIAARDVAEPDHILDWQRFVQAVGLADARDRHGSGGADLPISGLRSLNWKSLSFWQQQWDFLSHLVLPILVATFGGLAGFSRYMRQSMLEVIREDYIQSARAKGLPEPVVIGKHALRNAVLPVVTILGLSLPGLIGGSVIIESIFAIPGMGQLMVQSVFSRDYPVIMGNLVIVATLTLLANLLADIAYGLVDPRIRFASRRRR